MIRLLFFGSGPMELSEPGETGEKYFGKLEHVKLNPMSITIIRNSEIQGYVIIEAAFTISEEDKNNLSIPVEILLKDAINHSIFQNAELDINRLEKFDSTSIQKDIVVALNEKLGDGTIHDVLIQRIDFISTEDVRDNKLRKS